MFLKLKRKILEIKIKNWEYNKQLYQQSQQIKLDKISIKEKYKKKHTTSKLLISFLFINCILIEVYGCYVTQQEIELAKLTGMTPNLTPLISIISAIVGEVIGYAIYSIKATKENTKGGITYDMAMYEKNNLSDDN